MSVSVDIKKAFPTFTLEVAFRAGNESLGLLGASGCGKSVTLRCIAGLESPDEGRIEVNGTVFFDSAGGRKPRVNLSPQERKTALLFQNYMLFPNMSVKDNILAGVPKSVGAEERRKILETQLKRFKIEGLENRYPYRLSGGQQQRVALARMLATNPGILMLDEPFSALDAHLKSLLEQELLDLFDRFDGTILYVSHDIDEAFRFCDRICVVDHGTVAEIGPTRQIVDRPGSLATIRISGCKNSSAARKLGPHRVRAVDWGFDLTVDGAVPDDVAYIGVRDFMIAPAKEGDPNVVNLRVSRVSDSRYERSVMLEAVDRRFDVPIQWKVDKLAVPADELPERGDVLSLSFPTRPYLVNG